ncbi:unnamed protein product [Symbiodinium sp. CCMP2592]|nr:unnamed protein product [Symbiodinium sp. CCMP2592]CAE7399056.1 unnamed protein product [Symbiodinium sp. CCMP2592]CAE7762862.1 unnamed protein product [Symbiodinium sp. CCMP2592]
MSTTGGSITKTKEGVPQWSGEAQSFTEYEEQCLLYEQSVEYHKRYMVAPRLISELQGPAKRLVIGKKADWVSFAGGVRVLLDTLRASLGKPQVSEMADYLTKYFRQTRRKAQESMSDYITRKCEVYLRAQQSLRRVLPQHQKPRVTSKTTTTPTGSTQGGYGYTSWSRRTSVESTEGTSQAAAPVAESAPEAPTEEDRTSSQDDGRESWSEWSWQPWGQSWSGGWQGYPYYSDYYDWWKRSGGSHEDKGIEEDVTTEILPDFVQGWYLLFDASLNTTERNLIHTAVQGDYSLQRIAQELRSQWDDNNIRQRDNRHQTSDLGEDDEDYAEDDMEIQEGFAAEQLTEEGQALVAEAEEEAQEALALMQQARRTLREAREKQHQVKLSRQYFRSGANRSGTGTSRASTWASSRGAGPRDDSKMTCMKCGKVGHRASNCTQKEQQAQHTDETESAPFICFSEAALAANTNEELMTTQEAMKKGWCVVDGEATRTLGSMVALQSVLDCNAANLGQTKLLKVDTERRPTFSFGNSSENTCVSTVELGVQAGTKEGKLTVHALDAGSGPVLLSVASLRSLGAIIDFSEDLMVFRNLDEKRIVQAKRPKHLPPSRFTMSLNQMTKAVLVDHIRAHGEEPPEGWTVIELKARLAELDPSLTEAASRGAHKTELQKWVMKINKARAKKSEMIELCAKELELPLTGNETVSTLERLALQRASVITEPMARDTVGFGKHAALEYQDINRYQPGYREWVLKTDTEETGCDYRLRRLARWLRQNPAKGDQDENKPKTPELVKKKGGSRATGAKTIGSSVASSSMASSSETAPLTVDRDMIAMLQNLTGTIQHLQEKVAEMEESRERPRKKDTKAMSEATSEGYVKPENKN